MPDVLLFLVAIGWIGARVAYPGPWQNFGIVLAIALAVIPTLMGFRQDPMVQTVVLPIASGLVLGDVLHRVVAWITVKVQNVRKAHRRKPSASGRAKPRSRKEG